MITSGIKNIILIVKYQILVLRKLKISLDYQNRLVVLSWQLGNPNTTSCCGGGEKPMEKVAVAGLDDEKAKLDELINQRKERNEGKR